MTQQAKQPKLQDLKNQAFAIAKSLGLRCLTTQHFKKRVGIGLDLRCKYCWMQLIERLKELAGGVVVSLLQRQPIAA